MTVGEVFRFDSGVPHHFLRSARDPPPKTGVRNGLIATHGDTCDLHGDWYRLLPGQTGFYRTG
jgi:hypothetical protein